MLLQINKQDKRIQNLFQVFLLKNALRTLNLLCTMSQKERKRNILQRRLQSLLGFRGYVLSLFSILSARRDRWQRLDQFLYIKIHTCLRGLGQ